MSLRATRARNSRPLSERMEEAAALTGHVSYNREGIGMACRCTIETEHDSATGEVLPLEQIIARKRQAEETS